MLLSNEQSFHGYSRRKGLENLSVANATSLTIFVILFTDVGPSFGEQVQNVTVTKGRDAVLTCVTENLHGYKVSWAEKRMNCVVMAVSKTLLWIKMKMTNQNTTCYFLAMCLVRYHYIVT